MPLTGIVFFRQNVNLSVRFLNRNKPLASPTNQQLLCAAFCSRFCTRPRPSPSPKYESEVLNRKRLYSTTTTIPEEKLFFVRRDKNNIESLLLLLEDVYALKEARATPVVVENRLQAMLFYYSNLIKEEKEDFITEFAARFSINHETVVKLSKHLAELKPDDKLLMNTEEKLRDLLTPPYVWLFRYVGRLENGIRFLVDFRKDVLVLLTNLDATKSPSYLAVQQLNINLRELLSIWFSVGFLRLERVKWSSPCALLEKIADYEAVHPVRSWKDIKQRVGPYRRCFVYTHHSMPGEPLVVLHVALTKDIEHSMDNILHPKSGNKIVLRSNPDSVEEDEKNINAFIFYSISATQKGLQGIELGNYIIKRAAHELHLENPQATMFSTLSPIPTFRYWLMEKLQAAEKGHCDLPLQEWEEILNSLNPEDKLEAWNKIKSMIFDNSWFQDDNLKKALKHPLMASCSRYLYHEKKRGFAFDSVANFHLRNGAVMWRLNWLADTSPRGLTNSCGLMVNYRYYLDTSDANSLKYVQERSFTASEQIIQLAKPSNIPPQ